MRTKQEIQLELLQELDDICSKNNLNYIMVEQKSLYAYLKHTLNDDYRMVAVAMTQGDIDRFCQIVLNEKNEDRYIEGIFNNPHYIPVFVSYGNRNTTDLDTVHRNRNLHHGIRIRIYPIMKSVGRDGTIFEAWNKRLKKESTLRKILNKQIMSERLGYMRTGLRILNGLYSLTGGGTRYYNEVKKNSFIDRWEDIQKFSRVRIVNKYFSTEIFKYVTKIEIDGVDLAFPGNPDDYFIQAYGKDYKEKSIESRKLRNNVVIDTEVGYDKVINDTEDILNEIRSIHEDIVLKRRDVKDEFGAVQNVWRLVRMTEKQIEYQDYFMDDKINELLRLDLNNEEDLEIVYGELSPAISTLRRYANFGMTFSINPKIDSLIKNVLVIKKEDDLFKKINSISNRVYFIE